MENKLAMEMLGTTNIFKTLYLFIIWILKPQIAIKLAKKIVENIEDQEHRKSKIIAIGYLNEFFSKYIEFGKNNEEINNINQIIDGSKKDGLKNIKNFKIIEALQELRKIRLNIKKYSTDKKDQIVPTKRSFGVSNGKALGKALNIHSAIQKIPKGCIGIFATSGTKYTTQFTKCIGLIFLNGAITSHGSIIAREFNIPAIVYPNLKIKDGETVFIDGNTGLLKVVDRGK